MAGAAVIVECEYDLQQLCRELRKVSGRDRPVAIDTETSGLQVHRTGRDYCTGIAVAYDHPELGLRAWYVPVAHADTENVPIEMLTPLITQFNAHDGVTLYHHAPFDWSVLKRVDARFKPPKRLWDTLVVSWLIDENVRHGLKELGAVYFGEDAKEEQQELKKLLRGKTWADLSAKEIHKYAEQDVLLTLRLYDTQRQIIEWGNPGGTTLEAVGRECAFQEIVWKLNETGVQIDVERVQQLREEAQRKAAEIASEFDLNLNAPAQVAELVYDEWELRCREHTSTGGRSVAKAALEIEAEHEGVAKILEYRKLTKAVGTYYDALLDAVEADGRVRPWFRSTRTVTGRLSCVAEDTLIEMPRDLVKYPDGVPITEVQAGDLVYAFDWQRDLVLKRVKWVAQTGVRETVVLTVENSEGHRRVLRLTPDHLVRLRNGDYRPAGSLLRAWGQPQRIDPPRVMTMVRRSLNDNGYAYFFPHSLARGNGMAGGGRNLEHRWVAGAQRGKRVHWKYDVHHVDHNKCNNSPDNLEVILATEHREGHDRAPFREVPDIYSGPTDYRVISIEPGVVESVWDMEVEDAHNFIANGICVHNCSGPNLMTIPRGDTLVGVRDCFIAAPGYTLWEYDLKSAELYVQAALSGDALLTAVLLEGRDRHSETAAAVFGPDFTGLQRRLAKNLNYGWSYGIGAKKFARYMVAGTDQPVNNEVVAQARAILNDYARAYGGLAQLMRGLERYADKHGFVPLHKDGRYRRFRSPGKTVPSYNALNAVVQGGIAELMKDVMLKLDAPLTNMGARLCLQVHDSLVIEVPDPLNGQVVGDLLQTITDDINPFSLRMEWDAQPWSAHE